MDTHITVEQLGPLKALDAVSTCASRYEMSIMKVVGPKYPPTGLPSRPTPHLSLNRFVHYAFYLSLRVILVPRLPFPGGGGVGQRGRSPIHSKREM